MRLTLGTFFVGLGLLIPALPMLAHHSFEAEYDRSKPMKVSGTVSKVEWTNPHARFYLDVKDANGQVKTWNFELGSPNVLRRQGWTRHSLKEGDQVTVEGYRAKDASDLANARRVILADGTAVFAGSAGDNPAEKTGANPTQK